jgi:hypothetical protein
VTTRQDICYSFVCFSDFVDHNEARSSTASKDPCVFPLGQMRKKTLLATHYSVIKWEASFMLRFLRPFPALGGLQRLALLCAVTISAESIQATTLTVINTTDGGTGSLRSAITAAGNGDTIQFDATLSGQTINLTSAELAIDKNITISGPGPSQLAVSRVSGLFRIFNIRPGHTVIIEGLTISGGIADGPGGGVFNDNATVTIDHCIVRNNTSQKNLGGGIFSSGAQGGATMTILNSVISENSLQGIGGGIYNDGPIASTTMTIRNSTVSFNIALVEFPGNLGDAGGILNGATMEIINSTISDNRAQYTGAGIHNFGMLTIIDSIVSGNEAGSDSFSESGIGGGILNGGTLTITGSTLSDNSARKFGGGIDNDGTLTITNTTLSGNTANQDGGGIDNGGASTIASSTFTDNTASGNGGGICNANGGTLGIGNTILRAGALGTNIFNDASTVISHGYNLSSDNGGGLLTATGDQVNTNPLLGPLQNNGGSTLTHELLPGSPAIDSGDPSFTPPPLYDQRDLGYNRVFNGRIDIGSLEVQPGPPTPTATSTATATPTPTSTGTPAPTATATPPATPTPTPTASSAPARALNISTRLRVETGNNVMIGGFIIVGSAPKNVAVRGIGPSLSGFGISDALSDPTLELRAASGALLFQNDNWQDDTTQAAQLTGLGLALPNPKESGIVATLQPGASYTAVLAGKNGGTGVGLVEIYDANQAADSQLANISTRGFVQTGDNVMIGGFILGSGNNAQVVVRGIGPSLSQLGLSPVLNDPTLELRDGNGALLISNDNWQDDPLQAAQLSTHGLAPQDAHESGIFASLSPGTFTAILAGKNGGTGIGLVEIYNVQ